MDHGEVTISQRVQRSVCTTERAARRRSLRRRLTPLLASLLLASVLVVMPHGTAAAHRGSGVLPASATPLGYSRADMTRLLALFTTSGNDPQYYPDTPFQILYTDPGLVQFNFVTRDGTPCVTEPATPTCGLHVTQTGKFANTFQVRRGTPFFVPVDNADDSPPVVGNFPTTPRGAKKYVFDPAQLGGEGFVVCIDSVSTTLGPEYVAGPVTTPPLLDGGGTHMITIGAFLSPMKPGTHVVQIQGGYFGAGVFEATGIGFISLDFSYRVRVTR